MKNISVLTISMQKGGAERVISLLLKRLISDYNVFLYLFSNKIEFDIPKEVTVRLLTNKPPSSMKVSTWYSLVENFRKYLLIDNIQICISFLTRPNILNSLLTPKHIRTIISERCFPSIAYKSSLARLWAYKILLPIAYNKSFLLFSNSRFINSDLKNNFGYRGEARVLYNPVEEVIVKKVISKSSKINVVNVGRLYSVKNQMLLLKALGKEKDVLVTLVGGNDESNYKADLDNYILDKKISNVSFTGKVNDPIRYLMNSDVFVLSSQTEGFPNALLEAMECGLPVVSTNCMSGPLEILNLGEKVTIEDGSFYKAKYGLLINVNDPLGLKAAVLYLKDNVDSRFHYSKQAIKRASDFHLDSIYSSFINDILEK